MVFLLPCWVASVFSSVCDVREGRRGSFVERIVSLFSKTQRKETSGKFSMDINYNTSVKGPVL